MSATISTLGIKIGLIRKAKSPRMPVKQLAASAKLSENIIRRIEDGSRSISSDELERLSGALGMSQSELIATVRDDYEARVSLDYWGKLFTIRRLDDQPDRFTVMPADDLETARSDAVDAVGFRDLIESIQSDADLSVEPSTRHEQTLWMREAVSSMRREDLYSDANEALSERIAYLRYAAFRFPDDADL